MYGGPDYFAEYEKQILKIALIETVKGVGNMEAIARVPGLDMLYVGPNDLSIDYGGAPTYVASDPRVIDAMEQSIAIARRHGIRSGTYAGTVDVARSAIARGFDLVSVGYAAKLMIKACADVHAQTFAQTGR
jgi:4-hydroxy-2-oxoheptanedioate aldolase